MSAVGRLLSFALPLIKLRSQLRPVSLGVRVLVEDEAGRVLLVKHTYVPGWHFPGGGVEPGEHVREAASRELREEAGVQLRTHPRLLGIYHNPSWTRGDHVAFLHADAWDACRAKPGVEINAVAFFAPSALPDDVDGSVTRRLGEMNDQPPSPLW